MTKWEYLRVYVSESSRHRGEREQVTKIIANGVEVFNAGNVFTSKDPMNIYDYLNQLGKDGWELVYKGSGDYNDEAIFYLKRPLE